MPTIRPARPAEAADIHRLHRASILTFGPDAYDRAQVDAWAGSPDDEPDYPIGVDGHRFVVAERAGALSGFGHLDISAAEIMAVYVHPEHSRAGVGSAILADLESAARARDLGRLGLLASRNAVPFYEQAGYARIEERVHETDGQALVCLWMEKELG